MPERIRLYTYRVTCPLPSTKKGEKRVFTSYVYEQPDMGSAREEWFQTRLLGAKKNGLKGKESKLRERLTLTIERVTRTNDSRIAEIFGK